MTDFPIDIESERQLTYLPALDLFMGQLEIAF
jgi:hypothetical protein